ncbi:NAD(P)-dependent oxidoreductase [Paraburkholderia phytofirmans]|uniref:2-hydroxy-3-oxopropionate reductase n=1 Tax=Paraburkholderia phytofirmans (strain DSM 17436 / LMG 22146 / PsJN) TaxID=398527 RepID=B2T8P5_PARPJ|nr:NAD(P)-dependent oxidoreductase [Paraburkholderia phytofirmans]ACD20714.1 2-hydroxy-3-oxopropionate reductase [Paraburkholderia phytofirmans PsJN]
MWELESPRVGFCGLGKMGLPMTQRLLNSGRQVAVWNRSMQKAQALETAQPGQCKAFASPAELAGQANVVMLCLADSHAVEKVVFGTDGLVEGAGKNGIVLVDHSTITPAQTRSFAARWQETTGGHWVDAPVSGGTAGAIAGTLAVTAGGHATLVNYVAPLMVAYSANLTHMGELGAGQATKLANQVIVMTTIAAIAEATRLAEHAGVDAVRLPAALAGGWADSILLQTLQPRMVVPPETPSGSIRTMLKDLNAVESLACESGVALPIARRVQEWLQKAIDEGLGGSDISQIVKVKMT